MVCSGTAELNIECKSYLIFKILLMLMECRILLMGNTVEMAGGG